MPTGYVRISSAPQRRPFSKVSVFRRGRAIRRRPRTGRVRARLSPTGEYGFRKVSVFGIVVARRDEKRTMWSARAALKGELFRGIPVSGRRQGTVVASHAVKKGNGSSGRGPFDEPTRQARACALKSKDVAVDSPIGLTGAAGWTGLIVTALAHAFLDWRRPALVLPRHEPCFVTRSSIRVAAVMGGR